MTNKITSFVVLILLAAGGLYLYLNSAEKSLIAPPREDCTEITKDQLTTEVLDQSKEVIDVGEKAFICPKTIIEQPKPVSQPQAAVYKDLLKVYTPTSNEEVSEPISITGQARGNWFFEASFPIKLLDEKGNTIGEAIAQTNEDWMTTSFVSFSAEMKLRKPYNGPATLVFEKDNPSGLSENDDEFRLPVTIK